ncbi:2-keto-4-pentenoate hydratase [Longilinea arvoryzae]|uniref:2-keto-4-pentenoate hydratase n=1 Tax=Longilinea arvoryzae TaxID=360412 RepID=A0A0S7BLC5_9CHLR|nr:fumarylacetoacetate hydrolase family protein [Longilinea arvoryzae]GAP15475.1 2-keto-4-pentenoate hydratase [Longilinea arvoryzae]
MKLVTYDIAGRRGIGALKNDAVIDLTAAGLPASMRELIAGGAALLQSAARIEKPVLPLKGLHLLAPVPDPQKVVAIGLNYMDHCREQNVAVPTKPLVFAKFPSSIIGPEAPIYYDPALTNQVDWEAELGVIIGKRARNVKRAEALSYVFGYTPLNDVSARDLQFGDKQWVRGKSLDTFCPFGPAITTADEIPDPQKLHIYSRVNGMTMQDSSTSEMIFPVDELVAFLSNAFTLEPGDVIATGTPNGVGVFRTPKVFLQNGDRVEIEIENLGVLLNPVVTTA